jgi:ABC-type glycerol-3-phosphate transport system substrate-binding protein
MTFRENNVRMRATVLAAALILVPLGARAADLVVWWEEGFNSEEDEAVSEIIAAFEQASGNQVELVFHPNPDFPDRQRRASKPVNRRTSRSA